MSPTGPPDKYLFFVLDDNYANAAIQLDQQRAIGYGVLSVHHDPNLNHRVATLDGYTSGGFSTW